MGRSIWALAVLLAAIEPAFAAPPDLSIDLHPWNFEGRRLGTEASIYLKNSSTQARQILIGGNDAHPLTIEVMRLLGCAKSNSFCSLTARNS